MPCEMVNKLLKSLLYGLWVAACIMLLGSCGTLDSNENSTEVCSKEDPVDMPVNVAGSDSFIALDVPSEWCLSKELDQGDDDVFGNLPMLAKTFVGPGQFPGNHNTVTITVLVNESSQSIQQAADRMEAITSSGEWSGWSSIPLDEGEALERSLLNARYDQREAVVVIGQWMVQIGGSGIDHDTFVSFVEGVHLK